MLLVFLCGPGRQKVGQAKRICYRFDRGSGARGGRAPGGAEVGVAEQQTSVWTAFFLIWIADSNGIWR